MNEKLIKQIDELKQTLDTLPKNNKKNREKYFDVLSHSISEYSSISDMVHDEIVNRFSSINGKLSRNSDLDVQKENISSILNEISIFNKYNTSYEKLSLDKTFYNFYEKENKYFESIIKNIEKLIKIYNEVGIKLTALSFRYSPSFYKFMKLYFEDGNDKEKLKVEFEKIYWKVPNFISHIELSFKYIYYNNLKYFDKYIDMKTVSLSKRYEKGLALTYKDLKVKYDLEYEKDIYLIVEDFKSRKKNIGDYSSDKINSLLGEYIDGCSVDDEKYSSNIDIFKKLYRTLIEYEEYLKYINMIDDIKNIYKDKASYKDAVKLKFKEIVKSEKKLFKLTSKVFKLEKKGKNSDSYISLIDEVINEIKVLYDELEVAKFNENIYKLDDSATLIEVLELVNAYYIYQNNFYRKDNPDITLSEIDDNILDLLVFVISPYNNLINNITINEEVDVKETISNIYNLSMIKLSKEMFDDSSNIQKMKEDLEKILVNYYIKQSDISVSEIDYLCDVNDKGYVSNQFF